MVEVKLEKAIELLKGVELTLDTVSIDLLDALGKVIAQDILAPMHQPPFDRSPLDGYAVRGEDTEGQMPVTLKVVGHVYAGSVYKGSVNPGEAVRIMTGAPIPNDCNAIIKQEDTDYGDNIVTINKSHKPYDNYCYKGEDIKKGQILITKGTVLDYQHIGVLASMGYASVSVVRPLRIGLLCTGDEVVDPGEVLEPGKIYNSNKYILAAKLKKLGCEVVHVDNVVDSHEKVAQAIRDHIDAVDVMVTTGGVSVGVKDIMHDTLKELEAQRLFWKVQIQPGTPMLAAVYKGKALIGLSGNPFAAITTFEVVARPALSAWSQGGVKDIERLQVYVEGSFPKKCKRRRFVRAHYADGLVSIPSDNHSSGALYSMLACNALLDLPQGTHGVTSGDLVTVVKI